MPSGARTHINSLRIAAPFFIRETSKIRVSGSFQGIQQMKSRLERWLFWFWVRRTRRACVLLSVSVCLWLKIDGTTETQRHRENSKFLLAIGPSERYSFRRGIRSFLAYRFVVALPMTCPTLEPRPKDHEPKTLSARTSRHLLLFGWRDRTGDAARRLSAAVRHSGPTRGPAARRLPGRQEPARCHPHRGVSL